MYKNSGYLHSAIRNQFQGQQKKYKEIFFSLSQWARMKLISKVFDDTMWPSNAYKRGITLWGTHAKNIKEDYSIVHVERQLSKVFVFLNVFNTLNPSGSSDLLLDLFFT